MQSADITTVERTGLAGSVREAWDRGDSALLEARANYWMNVSFYRGHQWIWWDRTRRTVQMAPGRRNDNERVRAKVNRIRPRVNSLLGRLTTRPLHFEVPPSAVDDATLQAARVSESVLEARRVDDGWEELRSDGLFSTLMGATTLIMPDWDPSKKDAVVEAFSIAEFTLEPGTRRPRDARWMCLARALPPAQIKARYNLDFMPTAGATAGSSPLQRRLQASESRDDHNVELGVVYQYFERPNGKSKGRVATIVDDKVVEYEDWPYPFDELPGYVFRADIIPMQWHGDTPMNDARAVQSMYNMIRSTMIENAKQAANNRLMVPIGSGLDDFEFSDEPGEIVPYLPDQSGSKPSWLEAPSLPRDLRYETERLEDELDDILFTHAVTRGKAPGDRNSGLALSILAEKDDTPLGVLARDQQAGWARIASQVLKLYAKNVKETRSARIAVDGATPVTFQWDGKIIGTETDVIVPIDAVMPYSRAAMQSMMVELKQTFPEQFQNLDSSTFLRLMDLPTATHLREAMDDDVECAMRENALMSQGEVELPMRWHDHAVHIAEHNRERNSARYRYATEDVQSTIDDHILAHERLVAEEIAETQTLNQMVPGLGAMPSANERVGSLMPRDHIDAGSGATPALPAGPAPFPQ